MKQKRRGSLTITTAAFCAFLALVVQDGTTQTLFPLPARVETGGIVRAIAVQPDGKVVLGGTFTSLNGVARTNIGRVNADGTLDTTWNPGANDDVSALAVSGATIYAGGAFTSIGGQSRQHVAALDGTTGLPTSWVPSVESPVSVIAPAGGLVYLGGALFSVNGQPRIGIAAVDALTGSLTSWNPNANADVSAISIIGNAMYVGGGFTSIGGQPRNRIAALDLTTGSATSWDPGGADDRIEALVVSGNVVYAGGFFTKLGTLSRNYLAAIDASTGEVMNWNPNPDGTINALAVDGNQVYTTGDFVEIGGQPRPYLAALDAITGEATSFIGSQNTHGSALAVVNGVLNEGGGFNVVFGQPHYGIAAVDSLSGVPLPGLRSAGLAEPGIVTAVTASAADNQGRIVIAGAFALVDGYPRRGFARFNADGSLDLTWVPPHVEGTVTAIVPGVNAVYFGGDFDQVDGAARGYLAAFDAATGVLSDWNPSADAPVEAMALSGNRLYVGGYFGMIGGQPRPFIAAVDSITGDLIDWQPPAPVGSGPIYAIVPSNTAIYVGGDFYAIPNGNLGASYLAAFDLNTAALLPWSPTPDNVVHTLAFSGNTIYAGGEFLYVNGLFMPHLVAIDATTGQLVTGWNAAPNSTVHDVAVGTTAVYASGFFNFIGGQPRNTVAALNPITGAATSWNPHPLYGPGDVETINVLPDRVVLAGLFWSMDGQPRASIAAVSPSAGSAPSSTFLTSSVNPSSFGQMVTFTATVKASSFNGAVDFYDGATPVCLAVPLVLLVSSTEKATCNSAALSAGSHAITATYSGDIGSAPSTSSVLTQVVYTPPIGVTLVSSLNPSGVGVTVSFTATMTGQSPTGTVTFKDGSKTICSAVPLRGIGNSRTATCTTAALTRGRHSISATYSGDASNASAKSRILRQRVVN